jgi:hypothetical protein
VTEVAASPEHQRLFPRVEVALVGSWWTYDAPSISVAAADGHYVSIWSVGRGPSVLLVPATGDHSFWVPALGDLGASFTLHAMNRRRGSAAELESEDVALAAWAIGAEAVVACGSSVPIVREALAKSPGLLAAVLCNGEASSPRAAGPRASVEIAEVDVPGGGGQFVSASLVERIGKVLGTFDLKRAEVA